MMQFTFCHKLIASVIAISTAYLFIGVFCEKNDLNHGVGQSTAGESGDDREDVEDIHIVSLFAYEKRREDMKDSLKVYISSLTKHSTSSLHFHFISDAPNWNTVKSVIEENASVGTKYQISFIELDELKATYEGSLQGMRAHFGGNASFNQFNDTLFFLSTRIHHILPSTIHKVIMLDLDLKFKKDIRLLYEEFNQFTKTNIMGMAWEMQPAYLDVLFDAYRRLNPGTRLGSPPPDGFPGLNSGVVLYDLDRMRKSDVYNAMLEDDAVNNLVERYGGAVGFFGDQDFYNLLGFEHQELLHVLPCVFNRQLCQWWRNKREDVFDLYHKCEGDVVILHGNCKTPFPDDHDEL